MLTFGISFQFIWLEDKGYIQAHGALEKNQTEFRQVGL